MCVDDYQFRHLSTKKQKICRRFIFRSDQGYQRVFLVNISQFQRFGQLCLCEILLHLNKKGLNVSEYLFYMPQFDITIEAGDKCRVPFNIMTEKQVIFEMKKIEIDQQSENYERLYFHPLQVQNTMQLEQLKPDPCCMQCLQTSEPNKLQPTQVVCSKNTSSSDKNSSNMDEEQRSQKQIVEYEVQQYGIKVKNILNNSHNLSANNNQGKKHKQQQKTIQEALMKTKAWRMLHTNCSFSLKSAANLVELSKKTLDDYFLVLRVGQYHGYNFKANLNKKIGHLRAFIRNQPVKVTGRLSKQVNSFALVPQPDLTQFIKLPNWEKMQHIQQQQIGSQDRTESNGKIYGTGSEMVAQ